MFILPEDKYVLVLPLFDKVRFINAVSSHLLITSIKKTVIVDNLKNPQSALVLVKQKGFLGGKADNDVFNKSLFEFLFVKKKEEFLKLYNGDIFFYISSIDWFEALEKFFPYPFPIDRSYYEIEKITNKNWREKIPVGYTLEPVDLSLLKKSNLKNFDWIIEEIEECWSPLEEKLNEIVGFYLLKDKDEIVSWCTVEYLTPENDIELGIATKEEYQGKGFATIVGSATAEYCLSKYRSVGWHCGRKNIGSIKTAEKIGFKKQREYTNVGCTTNTVDNLVINGYIYSEKEMFEKALQFYQKLLDLYDQKHEDFNSSFYFTKEGFTIEKVHSSISDIISNKIKS